MNLMTKGRVIFIQFKKIYNYVLKYKSKPIILINILVLKMYLINKEIKENEVAITIKWIRLTLRL